MNPAGRTTLVFFLVSMASWLLVLCLPHLTEADTDVGQIAIIETDAAILQPGELFDLISKTITFTPKASGGYTVDIGDLNFDTRLGNNLNLGDDDSVFGNLGFTFPFFGVDNTTVSVNSNGHLTFGNVSALIHFNGGSVTSLGSDLSTVLDCIAGCLPRIATLWQDWNPTAGGGVFVNLFLDALIVTWNAVPLFGTTTTATFQVILFDSGVIRISYQSVTTTPDGGYLVGISPGSRSQFQVTTIDFSQGSGSISSAPKFEPLAQVFGSHGSPLVHISAVARRFFTTHGDDFDQMVMFANFSHSMGNAFAFLAPIQNSVSGIKRDSFDTSSFYGSAGQLQSFLNMNQLGIYPDNLACLQDPTCRIPGNNDSALTLMGQESGHQWLAFVEFDDGGVCSKELLGRADAHWSFFVDTDASDMEGNSWVDNGDGTFTTDEDTLRFSALDQYIMGLRAPADVPNFFFVDSPTGTAKTRSSIPQTGVTVSGTRKNVTIDQVIECSGGARSPSNGFSDVNPTTTWNQAFILLIKGDTAVPQADVDKLDTIRSAWIPYFEAATDNRGMVNTALTSVPTIFVTPNSLDFGTVNVGESTDKDFTVQHTGGGSLSGNASTSAPFSIVAGGSYNLAAGANQNVTVRFSPTSRGTVMTNVVFTGSGATKTVTGTGVGFTLTVAKTGSGSGTVTSSPAGINCGSDCSKPYTEGTVVTLTANPAADSLFTGWSGGGCTGTGTCTVTMNSDITVTATFNKIPRTLTVTKAGMGSGTVTSNPARINCGSTCSATFDSGTSVTLTASPSSGFALASWSGGCSGTGTCTVTMDADTSVTATFSRAFTDESLVTGVTPIKRLHITELRTAANQLRAQGGLAAFPFTDPTLTAGVTTVKRVHITELRTALTEAAAALGKPAPNFSTDPTITAEQTLIKAAHITELRNAVRALEEAMI